MILDGFAMWMPSREYEFPTGGFRTLAFAFGDRLGDSKRTGAPACALPTQLLPDTLRMC